LGTIEHLKWRYATKKFDATKKLSGEKLNILKQAFNLTATSYGLQTIKMIVVSDQNIKQDLLKYAYGQSQIVDASHILVLCIQDDITEKDIDAYFDHVVEIRNTPESILQPYRANLKQIMLDKTKEERMRWSSNQAYIALGNLMTVCAIEKIDACPMEGFMSEKFDEVLNLKAQNLKSILIMPVGYRAEDDMFADFKKVRKPLKEMVFDI